MTWPTMRRLLIVLGVYFIASLVSQWLHLLEALLHVSYGGGSFMPMFADAWIAAQERLPDTVAAAGAPFVLWYALGPTSTRRWIWVLAGVYVLFGAIGAGRALRVGMFDVLPYLIVRILTPAAGCLLGWLLAQRLLSAPGASASNDPTIDMPSTSPPKGQGLALGVTFGVLVFVIGVSVGVWMGIIVAFQWMPAASQQAPR